MLTLCGFAASNYYNKVKFVLLEKGLAFTESHIALSQDEALLQRSPLGKIPFLETDKGNLCESQVIVDYLEAAYPQPALYPADPFAAAQQREYITFIELYIELVARELYREAFFGGIVSEAAKTRVKKSLERHIQGFKRLAQFSPYLGGEQFGIADIAAFVSLPVVAQATQKIYGVDLLTEAQINWQPYIDFISERPAAQKIMVDRERYLKERGFIFQ